MKAPAVLPREAIPWTELPRNSPLILEVLRIVSIWVFPLYFMLKMSLFFFSIPIKLSKRVFNCIVYLIKVCGRIQYRASDRRLLSGDTSHHMQLEQKAPECPPSHRLLARLLLLQPNNSGHRHTQLTLRMSAVRKLAGRHTLHGPCRHSKHHAPAHTPRFRHKHAHRSQTLE